MEAGFKEGKIKHNMQIRRCQGVPQNRNDWKEVSTKTNMPTVCNIHNKFMCKGDAVVVTCKGLTSLSSGVIVYIEKEIVCHLYVEEIVG